MNISIGNLIESLGDISSQHSTSTITYRFYSEVANEIFKNTSFNKTDNSFETIGAFGKVCVPFLQMGAVSTFDIFKSLNELIIFAYYLKNKYKYKNVVDIGANIGLHSIMMGKLGWQVASYEPDPKHYDILTENISLNNLESRVTTILSAVSDRAGVSSFVRVLGNTTSSHLDGAKNNAYGDLEKIEVNLSNINHVINEVDFIKIDAEGHEGTIICNIPENKFSGIDVMVEVGSEANAIDIFNYCQSINLNLFSQKIGWNMVKKIDEVPKGYKEGSLFISKDRFMNWH